MKKAIVYLLVITLSLSFYLNCMAEEQNEYTFQNIPWFSAPEDCIQSLLDIGFINKAGAKQCSIEIKRINESENGLFNSKITFDKELGHYTICFGGKIPITKKLQKLTVSLSQIQKTIANQEITWMRFMYTLEPNNPRLVECCLSFEGQDYNAETVFDALIVAYGEPTTTDNGEYIWQGANNTIIIQNKGIVVFATLNGLQIAESFDMIGDEKEDTGF